MSDSQRFDKLVAYETAHLARQAQEQVGEDNVAPWLRVHTRLVQAALRGYRVGRRAAIQRAETQRN